MDFDNGRMKKRYPSVVPPDIENIPAPRRDLLKKGYFVQTMQTSRGCPYNCNFCSVTRFNGGRYRLRKIDGVIKEAAEMKDKRFFIIDDNVIGPGANAFG